MNSASQRPRGLLMCTNNEYKNFALLQTVQFKDSNLNIPWAILILILNLESCTD